MWFLHSLLVLGSHLPLLKKVSKLFSILFTGKVVFLNKVTIWCFLHKQFCKTTFMFNHIDHKNHAASNLSHRFFKEKTAFLPSEINSSSSDRHFFPHYHHAFSKPWTFQKILRRPSVNFGGKCGSTFLLQSLRLSHRLHDRCLVDAFRLW